MEVFMSGLPVDKEGMPDIFKKSAGFSRPLLERIAGILSESSQIVENVIDRELIVFLGRTGAGKSTAIGYLSGLNMVRVGKSRRKIVPEDQAAVEQLGVKISSGRDSCTMHATAVDSKYLSEDDLHHIAFLDTGGFNDNRPEGFVCNALTHFGMTASDGARILVLCVPETDIINSANARFTDLEGVLNKVCELFQSLNEPRFKEILHSLFLLVTHCSQGAATTEEYAEVLQELRDDLFRAVSRTARKANAAAERIVDMKSEQSGVAMLGEAVRQLAIVSEEAGGLELEEKDSITIRRKIMILDHFLHSMSEDSKLNQILQIDPCDLAGRSRNEILRAFGEYLQSNKMLISPASFSLMDAHAFRFYQVFDLFDVRMALCMQKFLEFQKKHTDFHQEAEELNAAVKNKKSFLEELKSSRNRKEALESELKERKSDLNDRKKEREKLKRRLQSMQKKLTDARKKLAEYDSDDLVEHWKETSEFWPDPVVTGATAAVVLATGYASAPMFMSAGAATETAVVAETVAAEALTAASVAVETEAAVIAGEVSNFIASHSEMVASATTAVLGVIRKYGKKAVVKVGEGVSFGKQYLFRRHHDFDYTGLPFSRENVEVEKTRGFFMGEQYSEQEGRYFVTFYPNPYMNSSATIRIQKPIREFPASQEKIKALEKQIEESKEEIEKVKKAKSKTEQQIKRKQGDIKEIEKEIKSLKEEQPELDKMELARFVEEQTEELKALQKRSKTAKQKRDDSQQDRERLKVFLIAHKGLVRFICEFYNNLHQESQSQFSLKLKCSQEFIALYEKVAQACVEMRPTAVKARTLERSAASLLQARGVFGDRGNEPGDPGLSDDENAKDPAVLRFQ